MRYILLTLLLFGCSPSSLEDFRLAGEAEAAQFTQELAPIQTTRALLEKEPQIKRHFYKLVDLMIAARKYQAEHPSDVPLERELIASENLKLELERIYQLEGGRECIERAAREPLLKLDAFEKDWEKTYRKRLG